MNVTADLLRSLGTDRTAFEARCESIAALVQRSDKAALEAILRIYDRQTADEKRVDLTKHTNGVGFQQSDARFGGFIARLYRSGKRPYVERMTRVRAMAVKYRRQLAVLSFVKDMERRMPAGSKSPVVIDRALREGVEVRAIEATPHDCGNGCDVRGCCCPC